MFWFIVSKNNCAPCVNVEKVLGTYMNTDKKGGSLQGSILLHVKVNNTKEFKDSINNQLQTFPYILGIQLQDTLVQNFLECLIKFVNKKDQEKLAAINNHSDKLIECVKIISELSYKELFNNKESDLANTIINFINLHNLHTTILTSTLFIDRIYSDTLNKDFK